MSWELHREIVAVICHQSWKSRDLRCHASQLLPGSWRGCFTGAGTKGLSIPRCMQCPCHSLQGKLHENGFWWFQWSRLNRELSRLERYVNILTLGLLHLLQVDVDTRTRCSEFLRKASASLPESDNYLQVTLDYAQRKGDVIISWIVSCDYVIYNRKAKRWLHSAVNGLYRGNGFVKSTYFMLLLFSLDTLLLRLGVLTSQGLRVGREANNNFHISTTNLNVILAPCPYF